MSYRVRYTTPSGATGYWEGTFATRTGATHSAQSRADTTGYTFVVEEVPAASTAAVLDGYTTERLVALMRERHAKGLSKYGTTVDRTDLTPQEWAQHAIEEMLDGAAYLTRLKDTLGQPAKRPEEVATPGSTAAHHVEILRERVKELEAEVKTLRERLNETLTDNDDIHCDLARVLQLGDAMREAMRTGEWCAGHDRSMASSVVAGWDRLKGILAKAPSVPVGASEAPRDGGDSGSSSFDALEAFLRSDTHRSIQAIEDGRFIVAVPGLMGSPASKTLKGISERVEEMVKSNAEWLKPISRPKDKFGEGTNRWRLNALERFLDGDDAASLTWHKGEFNAIAEDVAITAPTIAALADKLAERGVS